MGTKILIVEDDLTMNRLMVSHLSRLGHEVTGVVSRAEAEHYFDQHEPQLIIMDLRLPDVNGIDYLPEIPVSAPVIMLTAYSSVSSAVKAMKAGAFEYLVKPVNVEELELVVSRGLEHANLTHDHQFLSQQRQQEKHQGLIGNSLPMQQLQQQIEQAATHATPVLIFGEQGSGKSSIARTIHTLSSRHDGHYAVLNCEEYQDALLEAELFGHEKGALPGRIGRKLGLLEGARQGTLVLDEVEALSPELQQKLLTLLKEGRYSRLGGTRELIATARIIATSHMRPQTLLSEELLLPELLSILSAQQIAVPALREHTEDIPALIHHFLDNHPFSLTVPKRLAPSAMKRCTAHDWPGNILELQNAMERAVLLSSREEVIQVEHLPFREPGAPAPQESGITLKFPFEPTLGEMEKHYLEHLLRRYQGHRASVANKLGISERNLYRLIRKYGLQEVR
ncbi:sigma-54-dependent transcriptional regulator [Magnetococcus sp. PR-3]|uniref:sigma-54-dependent transcriptional regulator n=1 Tax=Magnetococcus sp. PR-3 TaxID=3120355 RepID=UPI002FCE1DE6